MFLALVIIGGFLLVFGSLTFIIDCFKIHILWGLSAIFLPIVSLVCLFKHWSETKRGFLVSLLAVPFLIGAGFIMPKANAKDAAGKSVKINDPFFNAMQKARETVTKVQESRKPEGTTPAVQPIPVVNSAMATPLPPVLTLPQRLAKNRAAFKTMETRFAALEAKRKALAKNDSKAIAAFNLEAKDYAASLAELRSEQAILLELDRTAKK